MKVVTLSPSQANARRALRERQDRLQVSILSVTKPSEKQQRPKNGESTHVALADFFVGELQLTLRGVEVWKNSRRQYLAEPRRRPRDKELLPVNFGREGVLARAMATALAAASERIENAQPLEDE